MQCFCVVMVKVDRAILRAFDLPDVSMYLSTGIQDGSTSIDGLKMHILLMQSFIDVQYHILGNRTVVPLPLGPNMFEPTGNFPTGSYLLCFAVYYFYIVRFYLVCSSIYSMAENVRFSCLVFCLNGRFIL